MPHGALLVLLADIASERLLVETHRADTTITEPEMLVLHTVTAQLPVAPIAQSNGVGNNKLLPPGGKTGMIDGPNRRITDVLHVSAL